jgi:hypothetical protein
MITYNISRDPNIPTPDTAYNYVNQQMAQDAAINEASVYGNDWYVLEVTSRPVFKASVTQTVTTEVM